MTEQDMNQWDNNLHESVTTYGPLARYVNLRVARAPGMPGTFSPPWRVSDPDMHQGTCVTQVPWCMPESLNSGFLWSRWLGNVPGIPGARTTRNFTYLVRGPWLGKISTNERRRNICNFSHWQRPHSNIDRKRACVGWFFSAVRKCICLI